MESDSVLFALGAAVVIIIGHLWQFFEPGFAKLSPEQKRQRLKMTAVGNAALLALVVADGYFDWTELNIPFLHHAASAALFAGMIVDIIVFWRLKPEGEKIGEGES